MNLVKGSVIVLFALAVSGCGAVLQGSNPQSIALRECPGDLTDIFTFQCYCTNDNTGG